MGKRTRIPTQKAQETAANGAGQQKKKDTSQIQEGTPVTGAGTTQQPVRTKTTTLGRLAGNETVILSEKKSRIEENCRSRDGAEGVGNRNYHIEQH